jgi:DNA-binding SARP family transcriptional activator
VSGVGCVVQGGVTGLANLDSVHVLALNSELPFVLSSAEIAAADPGPHADRSAVIDVLETLSRSHDSGRISGINAVTALHQLLLDVGEARRNLNALYESEAALLALIESMANTREDAARTAGWGRALPLMLGPASEEPAIDTVATPAVPGKVPAGMRVRLLGRFDVEIDGAPLPAWRSRRARQLFQYLLLNHGEDVSRHRLMGMFWPDHSEERAENNLSLTVMTLRRVLEQTAPGAGARVAFGAGSYHLDAHELWLDVDAFNAAIERGRGLAKAGDQAKAAEAYDTAIALYGGELLPGELYEEWTAGRRQRLQDRYVEALQHRAALGRLGGDSELSIRLLERVLEVDPALEAAHRQLILDYLQLGQRSRAAQQVEACREALRRHLGEEPDRESMAVFARVAAQFNRESIAD